MKCFRVMIEGKIHYSVSNSIMSDASLLSQPDGFFCTRFVLVRNSEQAPTKAIESVRRNLTRRFPEFRLGIISIDLEAVEIESAPYWFVLHPINRGYSFYLE